MIFQAEETRSRDISHLLILVSLAAATGIYMMINTVLISQDGVFYIESAQKIFDSPNYSIDRLPPGFFYLIAAAHTVVSSFVNNESIYVWIYSAQGITLLCRLLAIIPIYLIGKILVGAQKSFWAVFILIFLPYPAQICCEVLRDWPHILFLSTGLLFLIVGAKLVNRRTWFFGLAGLMAGAGFVIRHECSQLLLYGILWLILCVFNREPAVKIWRLAFDGIVLIAAFFIPSVFYLKARGDMLLPEFKSVIELFSLLPSAINQSSVVADAAADCFSTASALDAHLFTSLINILEGLSENLAYGFMPFVILGAFTAWKTMRAKSAEGFFVYTFILFNIVMLMLLDSSREYISKRHCLPLTVLLILYVPAGLETAAEWILHSVECLKLNTKQLTAILMVAGLISCLPKLIKPIGSEKAGYLRIAGWLNTRTPAEAVVAVPDYRISFYAMRKGVEYRRKTKLHRNDIPNSIRFIVLVADSKSKRVPKLFFPAEMKLKTVVNKKENQRIYVYKRS